MLLTTPRHMMMDKFIEYPSTETVRKIDRKVSCLSTKEKSTYRNSHINDPLGDAQVPLSKSYNSPKRLCDELSY